MLKITRQLGCVSQDMAPPKSSSIFRKSSNTRKPIRCVRFTKAVVRHANIRDQNPSLGMICPSDPHQRNTNAPKFEEVIFPKRKRRIYFPVADGRIKISGGDQELRTSTLIRDHPIRGESRRDFLGESEGSLPQPHDSLPSAGEAINDFWSMSGSFICRHHVEPRVKLYSPRDELFPIPLKYIDVSRTTQTSLDVIQERRIDDFWNIDGSRDLSDSWTGVTQFTLLKEKPPDGYMWSGMETDKTASDIQTRSFMARALDKLGKKCKAQGEAEMGN